MPKRRPKIDEPFDLSLSPEKLTETTEFLVEELDGAIRARSALMDDYGLIDLWHSLYEQAPRNRKGPWPGAADLGSYIGTEKVDATRARFVKIVGKAEPLCVVEGRGKESSQNAPYVEAAHEWLQQTKERFFLTLVRWAHQALIERMGVLETYEKVERLVTIEERTLLIEVDPANVDPGSGTPAPVLVDGEPVPVKGEKGYIDAKEGEPQAKIKIRTTKYVHHGPRHRVVSGKDFVWLPAHARDRDEEVYGYFKRFYRAHAKLQEDVKAGIYDKAAVDRLGTLGQRAQTANEERQRISVEHTGQQATQEHELWEGQVYLDLDGHGPRWHLVTVSLEHRVILRIKDDPINRCRFSLLVLFPRADGVDGYSFLGDKLYTLIEEHASERNMITDRSVMAFNAPILRMSGSSWNPSAQPWGPRQVITINESGEIEQLNVKDVPESGILRERQTLQAAERVSGASDIVSSGVVEGANPTATQVAQSAAYSNARLEEQVALFQEAIEQVYDLRHLMWIRALEFNDGIEVDESVLTQLQDRGLDLEDGKITAHLFRGQYRFKPRGSVESADPVLMERKFVQRYASLANLAQINKGVAMKLADPALADALLQDWADTFKPRDRAAFLRPTLPPAPPMGMPFGGGPPPEMPMLPPGMGEGPGPMPAPPMGVQ